MQLNLPKNIDMHKIITTAIFVFLALSTLATAQYPDKIIYNGKEYNLYSNPLETYFKDHADKRPKGGIMSTALWRGYVATFEIRSNQLFLKDIEIEYWDSTHPKNTDTKWKSVLSEVFPDQQPIKIDWISGLLVLPYGKIVNYVHMGYGSTYENYVLIEVKNGDFIKAREFDAESYEKYKDRQFEAFKKTDEYKKTKAQLKKDGSTDEFIDSFLRSFATDYTTTLIED